VRADPVRRTAARRVVAALAVAAYGFTTCAAVGLAPNLHQWGSVTLFHGLPSDRVRAIVQDAGGVLWFGTDAGLARFDGRRTQTVAIPGLPDGAVRSLAVDASDRLWVGTDGGAAVVTAGRATPVPGTAGAAVTAISVIAGRVLMAGDAGTVVSCTADDGGAPEVAALGPGDSGLLTLAERPASPAAAAPLPLTSVADLGGRLVLGSRGRGLLSAAGGGVEEVQMRPRPYFVTALARDADGRLWVGAETSRDDSGLYDCGDLARPRKVGSGLGTVLSLAFDASGGLWVGTAERGVFRIAGGMPAEQFTFESTAGGLRSNYVAAVFPDREGVVWFGTDRGVCRFDPGSPRVESVSGDPESDFARAVLVSSEGSTWYGSNRGLFVRGPNETGWTRVDAVGARTVHAVAESPDGRVLVGTSGGLFATPLRSARAGPPDFERLEPPPDGLGDSIRSIALLRGQVYLATFGRGLERVDGSRREVVWSGGDEGERALTYVFADRDERLWIGSAERGVFEYDGSRAVPVPGLERLTGVPVWSMAGRAAEGLWIATGAGAFVARGDGLASVVERVDVRAMVEERPGGAVWLGTVGGGLLKAAFLETGETLLSRFGAEHGFPSESVFALAAAPDRALLVGTNRGLARYEPGTAPPVLTLARVLARRAYAPEEVGAGLLLDYPQNGLAVEVAALSSRTFPEQFQYAFSLVDASGATVARRTGREAHFAAEGLRPGRYGMRVEAYSSDLVRSQPLAFSFEVAAAPFPRATAALAALLAAALAVVWWGFRKNRAISRANEALAETNARLAETRLQLARETESERRRIARDLHDQTLADLRHLMLSTDRLPPAAEPGALRGRIETISGEIRRICEDLSPSALENVGLAAALEWALASSVAALPAERRLEYEVVADERLEERARLDPTVQIQVYRILQETIGNVCRHADASRVRLEARAPEPGGLRVTLEDDGRGFEPASQQAPGGRGLGNIRSRASLVDAEVSWSPRPGGGTVFTLTRRANRS
jgi:signal transduction histidine kinase/ligand-binding sensor domain-containing protein